MERCAGAFVINDDKVLLVKQSEGHIGFPKGHIEGNEDEMSTAIRETKEETNIDIEILNKKRYQEEYHPKNNPSVLKKVTYFIARPLTFELKEQVGEIRNTMWVTFDEAINLLTYDEIRNLWIEVLKDITKKESN